MQILAAHKRQWVRRHQLSTMEPGTGEEGVLRARLAMREGKALFRADMPCLDVKGRR